jgi:hypothetical protein
MQLRGRFCLCLNIHRVRGHSIYGANDNLLDEYAFEIYYLLPIYMRTLYFSGGRTSILVYMHYECT